MKLNYKKTDLDRAREISDMRRNPIMRFLNHQDYFKFNIGDILIKQRRFSVTGEWETEVISGVKTPKKFMYVFENELGIGYIKQLRVDGSGFTTALTCTANFDPDMVRFQLDPDYVDHMLIGEEDFEYNKEYLNRKAFREEAIKKNSKLLIRTGTALKRAKWLSSLKKGDIFWMGDYLDDLPLNKYKVTTPVNDEDPLKITVEVLESNKFTIGASRILDEGVLAQRYVTETEPFPMEDPLCGPRR